MHEWVKVQKTSR